MSKVITALCLIGALAACNIRNTRHQNGTASDDGSAQFSDSTTVQIIDSAYNFGTVTDGEMVTYNYRFRNTGKHPLIISSALASCGCTVPEKPEHPIMPGEEGFLKVVFNSKGRVGDVYKTVTVTSNAYPKFPLLKLTGNVTAVSSKNSN
ncbi:MAG TPA: DUF1573 domain-containing protein [Chitinophagaceae bacterium]|nr:DUF1573 domain-containing protein [Chitinophagaceae bacterium]